MAIQVGPTTNVPTHDFTLSDGVTTLGFILCNSKGVRDIRAGFTQAPMPRTAMKLSQGAAKYEDFELPFTSIIQESFEGGMLAEDFESDTTKYRDGRFCNTERGDAICGPEETTTYLAHIEGQISGATDLLGLATYQKVVSEFIPTEDMRVTKIKMYINSGWVTGGDAIGAIYTDNAGVPGTELGYATVVGIDTTQPYVEEIEFSSAISLTSGTKYWVLANYKTTQYCYCRGISAPAYREILYYDGTSWISNGKDTYLAYQLISEHIASKIDLFEHRRALYALASYDDGKVPKLFLNGYRGTAKDNSTNLSRLVTSENIDQHDGGYTNNLKVVVLIIEGPGSQEERPWRYVVDSGTVGSDHVLIVDEDWIVPHTTDTSFVVIGLDYWQEITGHGLTKKITDIEIVYDYVAIAQGDSTPIRKFRWINSAGVGTNQFSDDGTNKADKLLMVADTEGSMKLWKALVNDNIVDYAPAQYYGVNHTFAGKNIKIGTSIYDDIKNLIAYGDPLIPYVIKENSFGSIENDIYAEIPIGELDEIRSEYNGIAVMKHNVFLYINLGEMIERYYDRRLDNVGPTTGEGMPDGRNGIVRKLLPYPGKYFAMLYSEGNTPSILCHNGLGWNEIWRDISSTDYAEKPTSISVLKAQTADINGVYKYIGDDAGGKPIYEKGDLQINYGLKTETLYSWRITDGTTIYYTSSAGNEAWPNLATWNLLEVLAADVPFGKVVTDVAGSRSTDMIIQVNPGTWPDRLWFDCNGEVRYIPIAINPIRDSHYTYRDLSQLETAWIYGSLKDVNKYWHSIKLHTENLGTDSGSLRSYAIYVEYKVDDDEDWTLAGIAYQSPIQEIELTDSYNLTGYRIKFRFTMHTTREYVTPRIKAIVIKAVTRIDVKKGWNVQCISTNETDLTNTMDSQASVMAKLYEWADSDRTPAPLTFRHNISDYDNKKVFIEAPGVAFNHLKLNKNSANYDREYQEILSFLMYEV